MVGTCGLLRFDQRLNDVLVDLHCRMKVSELCRRNIGHALLHNVIALLTHVYASIAILRTSSNRDSSALSADGVVS